MRTIRRHLLSRRELLVLALAVLPLIVTFSAIEAADWVDGLPSLILLVLVSLFMWVYLARSRIRGRFAHPLAFLGGLVVAVVLGAFTLTESGGLGDLASELGEWFGSIGSSQGDQGTLTTGVFLIAVTLWTGHLTAWLAYRSTSSYVAALPGLGVLLVVLTFLPTDFYWYFFMYLLASAPGVAYRHKGLWSVRGKRVPLLGTLMVGIALMGVTVGVSWKVPAPEGTVIPLASLVEDQVYSFRDAYSKLFHGVPDRKRFRFFSPPHSLPISGPISEDSDVLFEVESEEPHRWRMRVYEKYTGAGWEAHGPLEETPIFKASLPAFAADLQVRLPVEVLVRTFSKANALVSVGDPIASDLLTAVELSPAPTFRMYLEDSQVAYVPPELENYRGKMIASVGGSTARSNQTAFVQNRPLPYSLGLELDADGFRQLEVLEFLTDEEVEGPDDPPTPYVEIFRNGAPAGPPVSLLSSRVIVPPTQYHTLGSLSVATPDMLRSAGTNYPQWVTDRYLQLPNEYPESVRKLAQDLVGNSTRLPFPEEFAAGVLGGPPGRGTEEGLQAASDGQVVVASAFDAAIAIRNYLLTFEYSLEASLPPAGTDWVEHFLFTEKRGYCQNYATTMTTMLRSLGIPARLVVGFAPGDPNGTNKWLVRAKDYHAWVEVYFPGFGWVEFDPTPSSVQPALAHIEGPGSVPVFARAQEVDCAPEDLPFSDCQELLGETDNVVDVILELPGEGITPEQQGGDVGGGGSVGSVWSWSTIGVLLALAVVAAIAFFYMRKALDRFDYVEVAFAKVSVLGRMAGFGRGPQETPWEYCSRLILVLPEQREALTRITARFVEVRYARRQATRFGDAVWSLRDDWRGVRNALLRKILLRLVPRRPRRRVPSVSRV